MEFPSSWWPVHCARAISVNSKLIWQKSSPHVLLIASDLSKCKRCTKVLSSDKCSWADQSRRLLWGEVFFIWRKYFLCHKSHQRGWICLLLSEGQWVLLTPLGTQQSLWAPLYLSLWSVRLSQWDSNFAEFRIWRRSCLTKLCVWRAACFQREQLALRSCWHWNAHSCYER